MTDVLKIIKDIKLALRKEYGDVLGRPYTQEEKHDTYYVSDILADHGYDHDSDYRWAQEAINAAFIAGQRVGIKKEQIRQENHIGGLTDALKEISNLSNGW